MQSFFGSLCPYCGEKFAEGDDIVVCPECGTPHHRECYKENSACANEAKHSENYEWKAAFDAVLLDVPCSNSGVLQRRVDARWRLQPSEFERLAELQLQILTSAAAAVRPGGRLVYSTCSILPQENGQQVEAFLARHPEYEVVPMAAELPQALAQHETAHGLQMLAHRDGTDGFYVCRMRRVRV